MLIKCLKVLNWCIGKMYNLEKNIIHFSTSQTTMISEKTYKEREKKKKILTKMKNVYLKILNEILLTML